MRLPGRIDVLPLLGPLHEKLMELYAGLSDEQWQALTICRGWSVKDVAAHLLDTDLRKLSAGRDGYRAPSTPFSDKGGLVAYINDLNESWVSVMRRVSPQALREWQALTGPQVVAYWQGVDPEAEARFPVSWAGEARSSNWFDCAREYTERWHHQQQIRDAVKATPLMGEPWLAPILATFARALPMAYQNVPAERGTRVEFVFTGEMDSVWTIERWADMWLLFEGRAAKAAATVTTDSDTVWRIFTKGISLQQAAARTHVEGRSELRGPFLSALAIVAQRTSEDKT